MLKSQSILIVCGLVLIGVLFVLPKVAVKNPSGLATQESLSNKKMDKATHTDALSEQAQKKIQTAKLNLSKHADLATQKQWTDSLMVAFRVANQFDSAAVYAERLAEKAPSEVFWLKTGESYFEAFSYALDTTKMRKLAFKGYESYEKVLSFNSDNLLAQTKMGVLYKNLNPQAPMKGIQMVSGVVKKDPNNELALFYMGTFFAERGAFVEAIEKFEKVVEVNAQNPDAWIYLAQCYEETGKPNKTKEALTKVLSLQVAPEIKAEIEKKIKTIH